MPANDIIIIGGGIMGCATAYALSKRTSATITVIEQDPAYRTGSTNRSAGGVRMQFSTPENIAMSQATVSLLRNLKSEFGPDADVSFRESGYLILTTEKTKAVLAANVATQQSLNADIALLNPAELKSRFPWLNTATLAAGSFGRTGEGWIDPSALLNLFRRAAQSRGTKFKYAQAVDLVRDGKRIEAAILDDGSKLAAETFINAAGAWSGELAAKAGVKLPVEPRKRFVYVVDSRNAPAALHSAPLTVDPTGVWFRPEGSRFICGVSPDENSEPPIGDLDQIDEAPFHNIVWPTLAERVPAFESLKLVNSWAGYYDYNTLDQNAIIGRHREFANLYVATGFSGHGLQQGYAAGRALSELILDGKFTTIDLSRFSPDRISNNAPIFEANVI